MLIANGDTGKHQCEIWVTRLVGKISIVPKSAQRYSNTATSHPTNYFAPKPRGLPTKSSNEIRLQKPRLSMRWRESVTPKRDFLATMELKLSPRRIPILRSCWRSAEPNKVRWMSPPIWRPCRRRGRPEGELMRGLRTRSAMSGHRSSCGCGGIQVGGYIRGTVSGLRWRLSLRVSDSRRD